MSIKLIQFQINFEIQTLPEFNLEKYQIIWKLDSESQIIQIQKNQSNQLLQQQTNFILNQNRVYEDKITKILIKNNQEEIIKEFSFNLSCFLNKNQKEIYDSFLVNGKDKILLTLELQKLMALDLGSSNQTFQQQIESFKITNNNQQQIQQQNNVPKMQKDEELVENNINHIIQNQQSFYLIQKLTKENKRLKIFIGELKRQVEELQKAKPVYIQQEVEGFLREYQLENEKLRIHLKKVIQDNQSLRNELEKSTQQQFQNIFNFQYIIQKLEEKSQDALIECNNLKDNIQNIETISQQYQQTLDQLDQEEQKRKYELKKLLAGAKIQSLNELKKIEQESNTTEAQRNSLQSSEQYKEQSKNKLDFYEILDND